MKILTDILLILYGVLSIFVSIKNYDWYFAERTWLGGRTFRRVVYVFMGIIMTGVGIIRLIKN